MGKKRKRVPDVLWRLFKHNARPLAQTITSLLPQQPPSQPCPCIGSCSALCLLCAAGDYNKSMSILLRARDPPQYRDLLKNCFVVIDHAAPPLTLTHIRSPRCFSQKQIVERAIQDVISPNVLSSAYDKHSLSSPIVELLTSPEWSLLLERVGDRIMVFLLKYTSIFLSLPCNKHHQVTGHPISDLAFEALKHKADSQTRGKSIIQFGPRKIKGRADKTNSESHRHVAEQGCGFVETSESYCDFVGCETNSYERHSSCFSSSKSGELRCSDVSGLTTETSCDRFSSEEAQGTDQIAIKPRKRSRRFRWQRCNKYTNLDAESANNGISYSLSYHHVKQCSCCLLLQASVTMTKRGSIDRRRMFYNLEQSSSAFPRRLKPTIDGANSLLWSVFGLSNENLSATAEACSHSNSACSAGSSCIYHSLIKLLKLLIKRSKHCNHMELLDRHCSVLSMSPSEGYDDSDCQILGSDPQTETIRSYNSISQVVSFIWAVCRNVVPLDLLGAPSVWRILRRNIYKFIRLRRYERFSSKQCMYKVKTSAFSFLSDDHSFCFSGSEIQSYTARLGSGIDGKLNDVINNIKHIILEKWTFWFYSYLIVPLVQANFYVTESEHGDHNVYYYRKSVWEEVKTGVIIGMKKRNHRFLDTIDVKRVISDRLFGFSKIRLLPKENGVRMIANLKAPSSLPAQELSTEVCSGGIRDKAQSPRKVVRWKSVNSVLRETHAILKGIQSKEPEKLGASVFDYNDIYKRLCSFIMNLKGESERIPDVFVFVSDVSKAFDSIKQDKLLSVMKDEVLANKYLLKRSSHVICTKKSMWVNNNIVLAEGKASNSNAHAVLRSLLRFGSCNAVLVDQGRCVFMKKEHIMRMLNEHVKKNVFQLDKQFFLQGTGISQGGILSSLLFSFYYGHLERNVLYPYLEEERKSITKRFCTRHSSVDGLTSANIEENQVISSLRHILLRLIDDFLFISTSKEQAACFFQRLSKGFPEYNCYMNERKFCVSFDIEDGLRIPENRAYKGEDGILFLRWSGLLVNSCTLEIQADYSRYLKNHLSSSLTVAWQGKPGYHLSNKLHSFLRTKCHPLFLDSNINSPRVVRLNIYQVILVCAMKFHCYIFELSYICKLSEQFYLRIIIRSLRYTYTMAKRSMRAKYTDPCLRPVLKLEKEEVEWLGLNAYIEVLKRKQSRHRKLLSLLRSKLSRHRLCSEVSSELKYAVDRINSSLIWKIKY